MVDSSKIIGVDDIKDKKLWADLLCEFIATFILLAMGLGGLTCLSSDTMSVSLCYGLAAASMIKVFSPNCGCHMNPAVTVGLLIIGDISIIKSILYIVMHLFAAIASSCLFKLLPEHLYPLNLGVTTFGTEAYTAFCQEMIATMFLMMVVRGVTDSKRTVDGAPLAVGFGLATGIMFCATVTGGSLNPARSFGPAIVNNKWNGHWIYWAAPICGSIFGSLFYTLLHKDGGGDGAAPEGEE